MPVEIAIRPKLARDDIAAMVRDRLGGALEVVAHEEFTDGFFNAAHALALADGRELVVKVAPEPGHKLQRCDADLMATEIEFYERALAAGIPMPALRHADASGGVMIMDRLNGLPLPQAKDRMNQTELLVLRRQIGELGALLNTIEGERFGYPRSDRRTQSESWAEAFLAMIDDVLADNADFAIELPRPAAEIRAAVAAHRPLLDAVTRPALVHFDLWDGNIFVHQGDSGWEVEGLIDGERAFYGDALAELVWLTGFIPPEERAAVLDGYLGRELTDDEQRRLCLYRIYVWLILTCEGTARGYPPKEIAERHAWSSEMLDKDLAVLESSAVAAG
jgi:aminoglycoside phosphotransferase (APT) family kinase protein